MSEGNMKVHDWTFVAVVAVIALVAGLIGGIAITDATNDRQRTSESQPSAESDELAASAVNHPTNGTEVLLFPEWEHSKSAYERAMHTNLYAVAIDGKWVTRFRKPDGTMSKVWTGKDDLEDTPERLKRIFGMNIDWTVNKAVYDALQ